MNRVTITLTIDLPDGVVPDVEYGSGLLLRAEQEVVDREPPDLFPPMTPLNAPADAPAGGGRAPLCQHGIPMKRWPSGVNKQGKPFNASWRPSDAGCTTKPLWDRDPVEA